MARGPRAGLQPRRRGYFLRRHRRHRRAHAPQGAAWAQGQERRRARTREVKVGTVFTHRKPDQPDQRPERDYDSTTYIADIVSAKEFGTRLRAEAMRRGIARAKTIVFLGDGAGWVWELARINFPEAICILDYYHACEHLTLLSQALYGEGSALAKKRFRQWRKALLKDKIDQIIAQAKADLPARSQPRQLAKKQIAYFAAQPIPDALSNLSPSRLFHRIGRGGGRLQDGRRAAVQTIRHAVESPRSLQLLTVRCALLSGWFDDFWKHHNSAGQTLAFAA